jgi:hypothetical protein
MTTKLSSQQIDNEKLNLNIVGVLTYVTTNI